MTRLMRTVAGGLGLCMAASTAFAVDLDRARSRMDPGGPKPLPPMNQPATPSAPEAKPAEQAPGTAPQPQAAQPAPAPAAPQEVAAPAPPPLPDPKTVPVVPLDRVAAGAKELQGKMFRVDGDLAVLPGGESGVIRAGGKRVSVNFDGLRGADSSMIPACGRFGTCRVRLMARLAPEGKSVEAVQVISLSGGRFRF